MARPRRKPEKPKRQRGGQPGNRNRLVHGRYTASVLWRKRIGRRLRREGETLVALMKAFRGREKLEAFFASAHAKTSKSRFE